jgi:hypothetical protein
MSHDESGHAPMDRLTLFSNDGGPAPQMVPDGGGQRMPQTLPLDVLILDPDVQPRQTVSRGLIDAYAALYTDDGAEALPPIIVYQYDSHAWVADGFHRVAAAQQAGLAALLADVR